MARQYHLLDHDHLLKIVDSISDGVFTVDLDMKIVFVNKSAERMTGFNAEEIIGKNCKEIFQTDICDTNCALREAMASGVPVVNRPASIVNKNGRRIPISLSAALLRDSKGNVIGGLETFRDLAIAEHLRKEVETEYTFESIVSRNKKMLALFDILPTVALSESTVLIEGESGTGKELVARALHNLSRRKENPFVTINCGALPDTLLESELFGYVAGAFTDAKRDKKGRFAIAEGGTLLLDEISDISPAMQVELLRVLQERTYEPLGSTKTVTSDVRVVAVTNKRLEGLVADGKFRDDLFYRINVIKLVIPPLRERKEDIPMLVRHFIDQFNRLRHKDIAGVEPHALNILLKHDYPGNIRELENIIEHCFVLSGGTLINSTHLPDYLTESQQSSAAATAGTMQEMESLFILEALRRNGWSRKNTAKELGIDTSTLFRKIKKLGLKIPRSR